MSTTEKPSAAQWIESDTKQTCSPLGEDVAVIIAAMAGGGIYNAPINHGKVNWSAKQGIAVVWRGEMASFDGNALSVLWIESTRRMIRVSIEPCNPQYLRIRFHRRKGRPGELMEKDGKPLCIFERLPDCEQMIAEMDKWAGRENPVAAIQAKLDLSDDVCAERGLSIEGLEEEVQATQAKLDLLVVAVETVLGEDGYRAGSGVLRAAISKIKGGV